MKDESITPNRWRHRAQQSVILVRVVHSGRKNHISVGQRRGEVMKDVFDFVPMRWQSTVRKSMKARLGIRQEGVRRRLSLGTPLG